eukprot:TRINITY_DN3181_c1_g1_i3.p1 TRINITY_DN3181_c1_g1~~TRINITY_DN3181_c1_g1_i3.p1  ORF type:complete len:3754 (+),score=756.58 TRINITY_DN3181_c1_g1_i3:94-11355(+)
MDHSRRVPAVAPDENPGALSEAELAAVQRALGAAPADAEGELTLLIAWEDWVVVRIPMYSNSSASATATESCAPLSWGVKLTGCGHSAEGQIMRAELLRQKGVLPLRKLQPGESYFLEVRPQDATTAMDLRFTTAKGPSLLQGIVYPDALDVRWALPPPGTAHTLSDADEADEEMPTAAELAGRQAAGSEQRERKQKRPLRGAGPAAPSAAAAAGRPSVVPMPVCLQMEVVARPGRCLSQPIANVTIPVGGKALSGRQRIDEQNALSKEALPVNRAFFVTMRAALSAETALVGVSKRLVCIDATNAERAVVRPPPLEPPAPPPPPRTEVHDAAALLALQADKVVLGADGHDDEDGQPADVMGPLAAQVAADAHAADGPAPPPPPREEDSYVWGQWREEVRMLTLVDPTAQIAAVGADFVRVDWRRPAGCRAHAAAESDESFKPESDLRIAAMRVRVWQDPTSLILANAGRRNRNLLGRCRELSRRAVTWHEEAAHAQNSNSVQGLQPDAEYFMTLSFRNTVGGWSPLQRLRFATLKPVSLAALRVGCDRCDVVLVQSPRRKLKFSNIDVKYPRPTIWQSHAQAMKNRQPPDFDTSRPYTGRRTKRLPNSERWVNVAPPDEPERYAVRCIDIETGRVSVSACSAAEGQRRALRLPWDEDGGGDSPVGGAAVCISGLRPGAAYLLSARVHCRDWSGWAPPLLVTTPRTLRLRVVSRSETSLTVSWGRPTPPPVLHMPALQRVLDPPPGTTDAVFFAALGPAEKEKNVTGIRSLLPEAKLAAWEAATSWVRWVGLHRYLAPVNTGSLTVYFYDEWTDVKPPKREPKVRRPVIRPAEGGPEVHSQAAEEDEDSPSDAESEIDVYAVTDVVVGARTEIEQRRMHAQQQLWPESFKKVKRIRRDVEPTRTVDARVWYEPVPAVRLTLWREGGMLPSQGVLDDAGGGDGSPRSEEAEKELCRRTLIIGGGRGTRRFDGLPSFTLHSISVAVRSGEGPSTHWRTEHSLAARTLLAGCCLGLQRDTCPPPPQPVLPQEGRGSSPRALTEVIARGHGRSDEADAETDHVWDCDAHLADPLPPDHDLCLQLTSISEAYAGFHWKLPSKPAPVVQKGQADAGSEGNSAGPLKDLLAAIAAAQAQGEVQWESAADAVPPKPPSQKQWNGPAGPVAWHGGGPITQTTVGATREYRMRVARTSAAEQQQGQGDAVREIYFTSATPSVHVAGLSCGQEYEATLAVYDPRDCVWSRPSAPCRFQSLRPTVLWIADLHKDQVSFSWARDRVEGTSTMLGPVEEVLPEQTVQVMCYRALLRSYPLQGEPSDLELRVANVCTCSHHLYSLRPSTVHSVSVCPLYTGRLWGQPSDPVHFFYSYIRPKVTALTHDQLHVAWPHPVNELLPASTRQALADASQAAGSKGGSASWVGKLVLHVAGESIEECIELPPVTTDYHLSSLEPSAEYTLTLVFAHQLVPLEEGERLPVPGDGYPDDRPVRIKVLTHEVDTPALDSVGEDFCIISCSVQLFPPSSGPVDKHVGQRRHPAGATVKPVPNPPGQGFGYLENAAQRRGVVPVPAEQPLDGKLVLQLRVTQAMTGTSRIDTTEVDLLPEGAKPAVKPILQNIPNLRPNTQYSVQWRQQLACGALSSWSGALRLSTLPPLLPAAGVVGEEFVVLSWQRAPGLSEYIRHMPQVYQITVEEVSLRPEGAVAVPLLSPDFRQAVNQDKFEACLTTTFNSMTVDGLRPRTAYRARARQQTSTRGEVWGVWSHEIVFQTLPSMCPRVRCKGAHYIDFCWQREVRSATAPTHPIVAPAYDEERQHRLSPLVAAVIQVVDYTTQEIVDECRAECQEASAESRSYVTAPELRHSTVYALRVQMIYELPSGGAGGPKEYRESAWTDWLHVPTTPTALVHLVDVGETYLICGWRVPRPDVGELEQQLRDVELRRVTTSMRMITGSQAQAEPRQITALLAGPAAASPLSQAKSETGSDEEMLEVEDEQGALAIPARMRITPSMSHFTMQTDQPSPVLGRIPKLDFGGRIPVITDWDVEVAPIDGVAGAAFTKTALTADGVTRVGEAPHWQDDTGPDGCPVLRARLPNADNCPAHDDVVVSRLLPDRVYAIRVRALDDTGRVSPWSPPCGVATLPVPRVDIDSIAETFAVLRWYRPQFSSPLARAACEAAAAAEIAEAAAGSPKRAGALSKQQSPRSERFGGRGKRGAQAAGTLTALGGADPRRHLVVVRHAGHGREAKVVLDEILSEPLSSYKVTGLDAATRYTAMVRFANRWHDPAMDRATAGRASGEVGGALASERLAPPQQGRWGPWSQWTRFGTLTGAWARLTVDDIGQDYARIRWSCPVPSVGNEVLGSRGWSEMLPAAHMQPSPLLCAPPQRDRSASAENVLAAIDDAGADLPVRSATAAETERRVQRNSAPALVAKEYHKQRGPLAAAGAAQDWRGSTLRFATAGARVALPQPVPVRLFRVRAVRIDPAKPARQETPHGTPLPESPTAEPPIGSSVPGAAMRRLAQTAGPPDMDWIEEEVPNSLLSSAYDRHPERGSSKMSSATQRGTARAGTESTASDGSRDVEWCTHTFQLMGSSKQYDIAVRAVFEPVTADTGAEVSADDPDSSVCGIWAGGDGRPALRICTMPKVEFQIVSIGETWGHFSVRVPPREYPPGAICPERPEPCRFEISLNEKTQAQWLVMAQDPACFADLRLRKLQRDTFYQVRLRETRAGVAHGGWLPLASFSTQPHPPQVGELVECKNGWITFDWGVFDPKGQIGVTLKGDDVPEEYMFLVQMRRVRPKRNTGGANPQSQPPSSASSPAGAGAKTRLGYGDEPDPPDERIEWIEGSKWEEVGVTAVPRIRMPLPAGSSISNFCFRVCLSKCFVNTGDRLVPTWGAFSVVFHWKQPPPPLPATHLRCTELGKRHAVIAWDMPKNYRVQPGLVFGIYVDDAPQGHAPSWRPLEVTEGTSWRADGLAPSTTYRIAVRAESDFGRAASSNVLTFTTHVEAVNEPRMLRASEASTGRLDIRCPGADWLSMSPPGSPQAAAAATGSRAGTPQVGRRQLAPLRTTASQSGSATPVGRRHGAGSASEHSSPTPSRKATHQDRREVRGIPGIPPLPKPNNLFDKYRVQKDRKAQVLVKMQATTTDVRSRLGDRGKHIMALIDKSRLQMGDGKGSDTESQENGAGRSSNRLGDPSAGGLELSGADTPEGNTAAGTSQVATPTAGVAVRFAAPQHRGSGAAAARPADATGPARAKSGRATPAGKLTGRPASKTVVRTAPQPAVQGGPSASQKARQRASTVRYSDRQAKPAKAAGPLPGVERGGGRRLTGGQQPAAAAPAPAPAPAAPAAPAAAGPAAAGGQPAAAAPPAPASGADQTQLGTPLATGVSPVIDTGAELLARAAAAPLSPQRRTRHSAASAASGVTAPLTGPRRTDPAVDMFSSRADTGVTGSPLPDRRRRSSPAAPAHGESVPPLPDAARRSSTPPRQSPPPQPPAAEPAPPAEAEQAAPAVVEQEQQEEPWTPKATEPRSPKQSRAAGTPTPAGSRQPTQRSLEGSAEGSASGRQERQVSSSTPRDRKQQLPSSRSVSPGQRRATTASPATDQQPRRRSGHFSTQRRVSASAGSPPQRKSMSPSSSTQLPPVAPSSARRQTHSGRRSSRSAEREQSPASGSGGEESAFPPRRPRPSPRTVTRPDTPDRPITRGTDGSAESKGSSGHRDALPPDEAGAVHRGRLRRHKRRQQQDQHAQGLMTSGSTALSPTTALGPGTPQ